MRIDVKETILSTLALSEEKGSILYNKIKENIEKNELIELDFGNINKTITTFFNTSYGKLYDDFSVDFVENHIKFLNTKEITDLQIKIVKENAINYYTHKKSVENE